MRFPSANHSLTTRWMALLVVGVAVIAFARYYVFVGPPSSAELARAAPGTMLASDVDTSLVVFQQERRAYFDRVVVDRSPHLDFPSLPRWRVTGDWFYIPFSATQLVSAGIAPGNVGCWCARDGSETRVHLFGAVMSNEVAFIALQVDGAWKRYPVSAPGFIIKDVDAVDGEGIPLRLLRQDGSLIDEVTAARAGG
jgi:hypothetical protein